jgi:hypothetical protein
MSNFDSTKTRLAALLQDIEKGKIQLPDFQRGWVWDDEHKAFYDAVHGKKATPHRRKDKPKVTVWEIHPVMQLAVVDKGE